MSAESGASVAGSTPERISGTLPEGWSVEHGVTSVVAACCAFTFDAGHTDVADGGYSCPACEALELQRRIDRTLLFIAEVAMEYPAQSAIYGAWMAAARSLKTPTNGGAS